jgi:hypothetical protein
MSINLDNPQMGSNWYRKKIPDPWMAVRCFSSTMGGERKMHGVLASEGDGQEDAKEGPARVCGYGLDGYGYGSCLRYSFETHPCDRFGGFLRLSLKILTAFVQKENSSKQGYITTIDNDNDWTMNPRRTPLLLPHPLTTSTPLPPTPMHTQPLQHRCHYLWLQMNRLTCNAAQMMHNVVWAPVSFSLSFLCFIILANCSTLFFTVMM